MRRICFIVISSFIFCIGVFGGWGLTGICTETAFAEETALYPGGEPLPSPDLSGRIEGTGTYFELTDSQYLNVTLISSVPVTVSLESVPEMVTLLLGPAGDTVSAEITLGGFSPLTVYHLYRDGYHNHVPFTTDANGTYTFTQDIFQSHLIFIQPRPSTIFLSESGWSNPTVGTWDPVTRTATLTQDINETVEITGHCITLDGNGHSITGSGTGNGIYLTGRIGVTIRNVTVNNFSNGVFLYQSNSNTLTGNTFNYNQNGIYLSAYCNNNTIRENTLNHNGTGIHLRTNSSYNNFANNTANYNCNGFYLITSYSTHNVLTGNTASNNIGAGIRIVNSHQNTLTGNTVANNNECGILLYSSRVNTVTNNTASSNKHGIMTGSGSSRNIIADNIVSNNDGLGILIGWQCSYNTLEGNVVADNEGPGFSISMYCTDNVLKRNRATGNGWGIYLHSDGTRNNLIFTNNFINNTIQAYAYGSQGQGNLFDQPLPLGGNHWSNWTGPDENRDGIVDTPYVFTGGRDNLPWAMQDGWLDNIAPTTAVSLYGTTGNNGWYTSDVAVTLTAEDNTGGSGVSETLYSFDGSVWHTYTGPFTVTDEGTPTVQYYSKDNRGNVETAKQQVIQIDKTPPLITGAPVASPNANGWYNSDVTVSFTASDTVSGIAEVTPDTVVSTEGIDLSLTGTAVDNAGHSAQFTVTGIDIDKTDPVLTIKVPDNYAVMPVGTKLEFYASDALSGVASVIGYLSSEGGAVEISSGYAPGVGIYTLEAKAADAAGNTSQETRYFVVYDPEGGFVTGGGWIMSPTDAYTEDPTLTGKASFGFVSKYHKGATVPSGQTEFQFKTAGLNFHSSSYEWLVISGARAQYKGVGTLNGSGEYGFMLTTIDGQINGGGGADRFRIKIWERESGKIIYDNQMDAGDDEEPTTALGGGSIVIHK